MFGFEGLLLAGGAALVAVVLAFLKGRSTGKEAERAKVLKERAEAVTTSREIDNAVAGRDPQDNRDRLKKW